MLIIWLFHHNFSLVLREFPTTLICFINTARQSTLSCLLSQTHSLSFKVSGLCNNHKLKVNILKENNFTVFSFFYVKIQTQNSKLTYASKLGHFIKLGKKSKTLLIFDQHLALNYKRGEHFSVIFNFSVL